MSNLSVTATTYVNADPVRAFQMFADGDLLGAECAGLRPGAAIAITLPVTGIDTARGDRITILGRLMSIHHGHRVVIIQHQPWPGRLTIRFHRDGTGTRVALESQIDAEGIDWLVRRRGYDQPAPDGGSTHRIGLLLSKSGSAAVFAQATEALARMAVDEINESGGIANRPAELRVGDDASIYWAGVSEASRLARDGCRVIFACVTSATFNAVASALHGTGVLLVHTVVNEGGASRGDVVRLGERPLDQLRAGVPKMMADTGMTRWFFVGQRYSWSFGAHMSGRRVVSESGGSVVGEEYVDLGTDDFDQTLERIRRSRAELILTSLVGHDEVAFERACSRSGLRSVTRTLALVLDEATLALIGADAAEGVRTAFGYFQGLDDPANRSLVSRYRERFGLLIPPMSSLTETSYEAIHAYARAAHTNDNLGGAEFLASVRVPGVSEDPGTRRLVMPPIYLGEVDDGAIRMIDRFDA
ncbi:substrate-binding protein [Gordonia sp. CPCC 205515]|uniref:substrate-binding protein n=1 Tax=Gordonia sp. CPCC 205515 TaxID=3140791 RepID=UPI003AF34390